MTPLHPLLLWGQQWGVQCDLPGPLHAASFPRAGSHLILATICTGSCYFI